MTIKTTPQATIRRIFFGSLSLLLLSLGLFGIGVAWQFITDLRDRDQQRIYTKAVAADQMTTNWAKAHDYAMLTQQILAEGNYPYAADTLATMLEYLYRAETAATIYSSTIHNGGYLEDLVWTITASGVDLGRSRADLQQNLPLSTTQQQLLSAIIADLAVMQTHLPETLLETAQDDRLSTLLTETIKPKLYNPRVQR